jgi:L,D-transpeptidase YcbB
MRRIRFELWLATTAIALVAAGLSLPVQSAPLTEDEISAAVPMPEPANLPPPTVSDIAPQPSTDSPTAATPAQVASPAAARDSTQPTAAPAVATPEIATPVVATPPAVAPAEAPALTIDQRVAEKLRDMFGGRIDRIIDRKTKAPVEAFYGARNYAPIWVENGAENARGKAAATYLVGVSADGLDPSDYPIPSFANADVGALAESELKLTATALT